MDRFAIVVAVLFGLATHSQASELPRFTIAGAAPIECMHCWFAEDKGIYRKFGVDVAMKKVDTTDVSGLLASGSINAHVFTSSGIASMDQGRSCQKMVLPLVKFQQAIVGVIPRSMLEEEQRAIKAGTPLSREELTVRRLKAVAQKVYTFRVPSSAASVVEWVFEAAGVKPELVPIGKFTPQRVTQMIADGEGSATHASHPQLAYLRGTKEVKEIVPHGSPLVPEVIQAGLFVQCDDLNDIQRRDVLRRVVRALQAAAEYVHDPRNQAELDQWIAERVIGTSHQQMGTKFQDLTVMSVKNPEAPMSLEEAATMMRTDLVAGTFRGWPEPGTRERSVRGALSKAPRLPYAEFFDTTLVE